MAAETRIRSTVFPTIFVVVAVLASTADANCKTHDASWDAVKPPTISQPSRSDPTKIKVDWNPIITNGRCVDEYYIYVWKKGSAKETAVKIPVANKTAVDYTVTVEACIDYNFAVESVEHDLFGEKVRQSQQATFKSEAVPRLTTTNKQVFKVGYYFDKTKGVNDLSKVSIRFPKSILEHASCIKHIEVKGTLDTLYSTAAGAGRYYSQVVSSQQSSSSSSSSSTHGYYLRSQSSSSSIGGSGSYPGSGVGGQGQYPGGSVGGQGQYPGGSGSVGGQGQYPGGSGSVGGQGQYPGGSGSVGGQGQYPGGSGSVGGQGQYPGGSGSVGGQGQYPGGSGIGGSGSYPGGSGIGGSGSYPGGQTRPDYHPNTLYPDHSHTIGWHGRPPYTQQGSVPGSPNRYKRYVGGTTTTLKPPIATYPTSTTKPPYVSGQPSVTASPPFLLDTIEILVDNVEPCKPYRFNLKVVSPQGSSLGEIDGLILPLLPDMADYHPPPLAQLFRVQLQAAGQPPIITLQPGLGVPATCLPEFFEAVDRHMQRLESDLHFHVGQESKAHSSIDYFKKQLSEEGSNQLRLLGCLCNSTSVILTSNDSTVTQKFGHALGTFVYDGMHQGRPYYRKPSRHQTAHIQAPQVVQNVPPPVGGYAPATTTTTTTTTTPAPAAAGVKIMFMYWDQSDKSWMVGETLGMQSPTLKTSSNSYAKCPGDPHSFKSWTYTSTFKWKSDPTMNAECPNITFD